MSRRKGITIDTYKIEFVAVADLTIGSAVGLTASPLFTEVDKIHTSVGLWKITLYGQVGESV